MAVGILEPLAEMAKAFVETGGYLGVFVLMAMESMFFPVPSEAVMPPAGILVAEGKMALWPVVLASSLGSLAGSLLSYWIGHAGAAPFVRRWGKWFLLREKHLDEAHEFFEKRGALAIFLARFVPGVRHVSSIPAGAARMPLLPFCIATLLGASAWNMTLLWGGVVLGNNWELVLEYLVFVEYAVIVFGAGAALWFALRWYRRRGTVA